MKRPRKYVLILLAVALFLVSFAVRARHPLSRPPQWYLRSLAFEDAIHSHDWEATFQRYHPGVTTMALGALGHVVYYKVESSPSILFEPARWVYEWSIPEGATYTGTEVAAMIVMLALALSVLVVIIAWAVGRLGGWQAGVVAGGILAFAPHLLFQSRILHVDALLSSFMILSALLLLIYLKEKKLVFLLASGLSGGLAFLTKLPSVFLVPYVGLACGVYLVLDLRSGWADHEDRRAGWILSEVWKILVGPGLIWLAMAALPFLFWPVMWVKPVEILDAMYVRAAFHAATTHDDPRFLLGRLYYPGEKTNPLFYVVSLIFNSSFVTFSLAILAVVLYVVRRRDRRLPFDMVTFWLLVAYVFFFWMMMTIGQKYDQRYITPAHVGLEILAAVGGACLIDLVSRAAVVKRFSWSSAVPLTLAALVIVLQALSALPYAPDYGASHNHLLGGNRGAQHALELGDQHEGMLSAADFIREQVGEDAAVGMPSRVLTSFEQYYPDYNTLNMGDDVDYHLFPVVHIQRDLKPFQWEEYWDRYAGQEPVFALFFDGVEYIWIYAAKDSAALPYTEVRRGGMWLVVVAWVWTAALIGGTVWSSSALRGEPVEQPAA